MAGPWGCYSLLGFDGNLSISELRSGHSQQLLCVAVGKELRWFRSLTAGVKADALLRVSVAAGSSPLCEGWWADDR